MGVVSAILKFANVDMIVNVGGVPFAETPWASLVALIMYVAVIAYMIWDSKRAKTE
jgi:hypothetical protein